MKDILQKLDKLILETKRFNKKNVLEAYYPTGELYAEIPLDEDIDQVAYDEGVARLLYRTPLSYTFMYSTTKGKIIPKHFHKYKETIVIISGKCMFEINEKEYILEKYDKLIIEPFVTHNFIALDDFEALAIIEI